MSLAINTPATVYMLPRDGAEARCAFLGLLRSPGETWILDYGFTEADLIAEIEQNDAAGIAMHLLLDRSQSAGTAESKALAALSAKLVHGDITMTTAGPDSAGSSEIMHDKVMVVAASDGGQAHVWLGSVNFSESGWYQANTALLLRSDAMAQMLIDFFDRTRQWALEHVPQLGAKGKAS